MTREAGFRIDRDRGATPPAEDRSRTSATTALITAAAGAAFVVAVIARLTG